MQKGFTGIRPVNLIDNTSFPRGQYVILIYNDSPVNLYLGDDNVSANVNNGIPILPAAFFSTPWEGDLWIGADADSTSFRYMTSKPLSFQQNNNQTRITKQGFLAPKAVIAFLFCLLSLFAKPIQAQQYATIPVIGNKVTILNGASTTTQSVGPTNLLYSIGPVPANSQFVLDIDNARTIGTIHATTAFSMYCSIDPVLNTLPLGTTGAIPIAFNYQFTSSLATQVYSSPLNSNGVNTPSLSVPVGSHLIITTGYLPCTRIILGLGTLTNPNTDLIGVYGVFIQSPISHSLVLNNFDPSTNNYNHETDATAHTVKASQGYVHTVTVNTGGAGTLTLFDLPPASCTGTPVTGLVHVWTITATTLQSFILDENFINGICIKAAVAMDYTVSFQ